MPGGTARTILGGREIIKDLQAAAARVRTTQRAGLGHLLGEVRSIAIGIAIKIKIEMEAVAGTKIAIGTAHSGRTGVGAKSPVPKAEETMQAWWDHFL